MPRSGWVRVAVEIWVDVDFGFEIRVEIALRLMGWNMDTHL